MPQALWLPRLLARLSRMSFVCRVVTQTPCAGVDERPDRLPWGNDHGLGRQELTRRRLTLGAGGRLLEWPTPPPTADAYRSQPLRRGPTTGFLISVPAQQHSPVARPTSLLTAGNEGQVDGLLRSKRREAAAGSHRIDLLRRRCPLGTIVPVRGNRSCREDGRTAFAPATSGRPASAHNDKEVL